MKKIIITATHKRRKGIQTNAGSHSGGWHRWTEAGLPVDSILRACLKSQRLEGGGRKIRVQGQLRHIGLSQNKTKTKGGEGSSMVKVNFSSRGPKFRPQHPHKVVHNCQGLQLQGPSTFWALRPSAHTFTQA